LKAANRAWRDPVARHGKARPCGSAQGPGRDCLAAGAAGNPHVARHAGARHQHGRAYTVTPEGGDAFTLVATGREAWTLDRLSEAGPRGCTPREEPAPRWSAYVHRLRERGVPIETLREAHGGAYPGWHGRYILRGTVRRAGA
jgi:hypothetical protein